MATAPMREPVQTGSVGSVQGPKVGPALPPAPLTGAILVSLIASSFGFLEESHHHPALKLGGAMLLAVAGTATVLAVRYLAAGPGAGHDAVHGLEAERGDAAGGAVRGVIASATAFLSMSAALIHFAVVQQHWVEYVLYGVFFIVIGLFQALWAILVWTRSSRILVLSGALGNLAIAAAWVVTRTVGTLIGPAAHETASVGFGDLLSTVFEILIAMGCVLILAKSWANRPVHPGRAEFLVSGLALAVTVLTILGLFSSVGGSPFVTPVG